MKFQHIPICILAATTLLQCSKSKESGKDPLPAAPVNCENAQGNCFRCDINGEEWVPEAPSSVGGPIAYYLSYNEQTDILYGELVRKNTEKNQFECMKIYIQDIKNGIPSLWNVGQAHAFRDYQGNYPCANLYYNSSHANTLEIILNDTINQIIEGSFEFEFYNAACGVDSVLAVQNGHFRFHY